LALTHVALDVLEARRGAEWRVKRTGCIEHLLPQGPVGGAIERIAFTGSSAGSRLTNWTSSEARSTDYKVPTANHRKPAVPLSSEALPAGGY
jgi:hypothetical protein